ncbi:MAG: NUMOD4 domain-containing protein [Bacilli bacterium]
MIEEIWKPIVGYEGLYEVSNIGRVKSLERKFTYKNRYGSITQTIKKEKILNLSIQYPNKNIKYRRYRVSLSKELKKKDFMVHKLVAQAFIPNSNNYPQINHKDGNPLNNNYLNLEWCTQKYNTIHSYTYLRKKKYDEDKIIKMIENNIPPYKVMKENNISRTIYDRLIKKHHLQLNGTSFWQDKYHIDLNELLIDLKNGIKTKELVEKYKCSKNIINIRKYQFKKKGLI